MDKDFMSVHTYQYNQILKEIEDALNTKASWVNNDSMADHSEYRITTIGGEVQVSIYRWFLSTINLKTEIKITFDHEVVLNTAIKSDAELTRIQQIIRCLNPERLASGITACDDELPDLIDDTDYLLDERYEWITPDFSGLEPDPFEFV